MWLRNGGGFEKRIVCCSRPTGWAPPRAHGMVGGAAGGVGGGGRGGVCECGRWCAACAVGALLSRKSVRVGGGRRGCVPDGGGRAGVAASIVGCRSSCPTVRALIGPVDADIGPAASPPCPGTLPAGSMHGGARGGRTAGMCRGEWPSALRRRQLISLWPGPHLHSHSPISDVDVRRRRTTGKSEIGKRAPGSKQ